MNYYTINKIKWRDFNNKIAISLPATFNYKENLNYLKRNNDECMFKVIDDSVRTVISTAKDHLFVQIDENDDKEMIITFLNENRPEHFEGRHEIVNYIIEWFDLTFEIEGFYEMAQTDEILQKSVEQFYGLRLIGVPNLFEALSWAIISQQINLSYANKLKRQFVEQFGKSISYDGEQYWVFPSPETIANLSIIDFSNFKMTERKKEYLLCVANLIASSQLSKEKLLEVKDIKEAEKQLTSIRGIGPWSANYVLMRCLRYDEAFPIADVGLHNAIKLMKSTDEKPSKQLLTELAKRWHPYEAYATFYLWRLLY